MSSFLVDKSCFFIVKCLCLGGNPVFRVYDIDPDTYEVMDFTPFYGTLLTSPHLTPYLLTEPPLKANRSLPSFQIEPKWKPYYSARESYGSMVNPPLEFNQSLDAKFWHRVTDKFQEDRFVCSSSLIVLQQLIRSLLFRASFLLFNERKSRGGKVLECKSNHCRKKDICMLRSLRSESNCVRPSFLFLSLGFAQPLTPVAGSGCDPTRFNF